MNGAVIWPLIPVWIAKHQLDDSDVIERHAARALWADPTDAPVFHPNRHLVWDSATGWRTEKFKLGLRCHMNA
jgi:hypothetical protein